jgi:hypothetical protein
MTMRVGKGWGLVLLALAAGCSELRASGGGDEAAVPAGWYRPAVHASWHWQLSGTVNTAHDVDVYVIDLFDNTPALIAALHGAGRRVICYFSAGSYEHWRPDAWRYAGVDLGNTLDGYADERWVDTRSANVRAILRARMDLAVAKGCDGVEPDNVDGYTQDSGFPLTAQDQLDFNIALADAAHQRGLAVALKNDVEQIGELHSHFDFAINESCHRYRECQTLAPFVDSGKPVFNAEYQSKYVTSSANRATLCADARARNFRTLVLPKRLNDAFRYSCD